MHKEKTLFVHIPKTGGTSILNKIDQSMWKKVIYAGHDPFFILESNNNLENTFSFCVVRNPYRRTFSYFNHFKRENNIDCSYIEFLKILKRKDYYKKTPMIVYPQSFYVYNSKGEISIDKIYRYENFGKIEEDFDIQFENLNSGNYTQKDYSDAYENEECVSIIQELFSVDFINFKYDWTEI